MKILSVEEFTKIICKLVDDVGNITLSNPDSEDDFPIGVISNTMRSIEKIENNIPIIARYSISIFWWTNSKYESMKLENKTTELLLKYNVIPIGNQNDNYDEITKKYIYGYRYEVIYNGLTNSFNRVK